jgi:UDP-N-acetylglucosamine 2-epimerase
MSNDSILDLLELFEAVIVYRLKPRNSRIYEIATQIYKDLHSLNYEDPLWIKTFLQLRQQWMDKDKV